MVSYVFLNYKSATLVSDPCSDDPEELDYSHSRTSTKCPPHAAAAAIAGDTKCVRPPRPWRPSKLRFEVDAQRSPGSSLSGFIARHMEQPGSRQSNPAAVNTSCSPSASASCLTAHDPGTTSVLMPDATRCPR